MVTGLDDTARADVASALANVRRTTSGAVWCVVARRVSSHRDVSLVWAVGLALTAPLAALLLGWRPDMSPAAGGGWEVAHLAARDHTVAQALLGYGLHQLFVFVAGFLIARWALVRRWSTPRSVRRARVRAAAVVQFAALSAARPKAPAGVLIFVSVDDRRVEVIVDPATLDRAGPDALADVAGDLAQALRAGRTGEGLAAAVVAAGALMATHAAPDDHGRDTAPGRLIELQGPSPRAA